jgi:lysophospholipase L1-like esterase
MKMHPTRRPAPAAAQARIMRNGLSHGKAAAAAVLAGKGKGAKGGSGRSGLLIAEGDSWFDYPGDDVLAILEDDFGYRVESAAHRGDTVEGIAYDPTQVRTLARAFEHVRQDGRVPRAILLSGGGNDIAGDEFAVLLNHAESQLPPLNPRIVEGILDERLRFAISSVLGAITSLSQSAFGRKVPVLMHGYGYPVPDGRGFLGGFWVLPGPWLKPGFAAKGYHDLQRCCTILEDLIDRFNALLQSIAGSPGFEHVTYCDMRPLLSNELPRVYRKSWTDELHPTDDGFKRVAGRLDQEISRVAPLPAAPRGPQSAGSRAEGRPAGTPKARSSSRR